MKKLEKLGKLESFNNSLLEDVKLVNIRGGGFSPIAGYPDDPGGDGGDVQYTLTVSVSGPNIGQQDFWKWCRTGDSGAYASDGFAGWK